MSTEVNQPEEIVSVKQKKENLTDSDNSVPLQPLILGQDPKNIKAVKSLPYDFGAETYDVYRNPKNPFMVGIVAAETEKIELDPVKTQSLFQQLEKKSPYSLEYPLNISAHRKRKLSATAEKIKADADSETEFNVNESKLKNASAEYLPKEKLKENKRKLQVYIQGFFSHVLKSLGDESGGLAVIINEIVPLFVKYQIRVRFYQAFRQIRSMDDLIAVLEKISNDSELENFELFCSALFVFYSSQRA
ncbi:MAG: hypothetical protein H8E38_08255 [SAR324 cluster bacterium]|nr:hypothetical protein [SAR324 cluster bacterium]MBL7035155.1 hypothetical protein [SAR324 cluster bacterium]